MDYYDILFAKYLTKRKILPLGGKLYYIHPNGDGVYIFYDNLGKLVTESQVQQAFAEKNHNLIDSLASYAIVEKGLVDKYYVYHDTMYTSKRWTYYDPETIVEGDPRYNANWPGYAFESLGTSRAIGAGKTNTQKVMEKDGGVYASHTETIWNQLKIARENRLGGRDDWFIPSDNEIEELRKAIGFTKITTSDEPVVLSASAVTGGTIAGVADNQTHYRDYSTTRTCYPSATKFLNNYIWSSSEGSSIGSWIWNWLNQYWDGNGKHHSYSVFFARAF